jgi:uncharacterized membrane protein
LTLRPLLAAAPLIQVHALCAISALLLGIAQFATPKGTPRHRLMGWAWVLLMAAIALSSFGIGSLRPGSLSFVHVISALTLLALPVGVLHARRGRVRAHRIAMISLFVGALIIAGAFTLLPSRIMGRVVFG